MKSYEKIGRQKSFDYLLVALAAAVGFYLDWSPSRVALLIFVVWQILFPIPSKILAKATMLTLLIFPVMIITNIDNRSEDLGTLIFCLFVVTLVMIIVERKSDRPERKLQDD